MPCRSPLTAYRTKDGITFTDRKASLGRFGFLTFRCGVCRDCRLYRSREWAIRAYHEGQLHRNSCFVDLTFKDEPLSIAKRDLQLFFKSLRKSLPGVKIKYFAVGEYGENFSRPHYHVCIFGWDPPDKYPWRRSKKGTLLYRSAHLEKVWTHGFVTVSPISPEAVGYAARYTLKKINGNMAVKHYEGRQAEFNLCSLGLGKKWIEQHYQDVFRHGYVVYKGKECPIPSYYLRWVKDHHPDLFEKFKRRQQEFHEQQPYESGKRLHQAAQARDHRTKSLARDFENSSQATGVPTTRDKYD